MNEETAILQLMLAKGLGTATLRRLLLKAKATNRSIFELLGMTDHEWLRDFGIKSDIVRAIEAAREDAIALSAKLRAQAVEILAIGTKQYPEHLHTVLKDTAPPLLFAKGNTRILTKRSVGLSGSRKASAKGIGVASTVAGMLAEQDINVVSGYAHGVDLAAHQSAMKSHGVTTLVLAEGILHYYAKGDIAQYLDAANHLILSEFPPSLGWIARNAMVRNRTICALSDAVIVIEAGLSGGTFAAGETALAIHRPLFVVEYVNPEPSAEGNAILRQKGAQSLRADKDGKPLLDNIFSAIKKTDNQSNTTVSNSATLHQIALKAAPKPTDEVGNTNLPVQSKTGNNLQSSQICTSKGLPTMTTDRPRLIEAAFPLEQASLDSVHEKNVRHGHISTLHIWPARRPLAASRAALIATLLPDPGTPEGRADLVRKIGGTVVETEKTEQKGGKKVKSTKRETRGGILHWGQESDPAMDEFRDQIRAAYGGRAPRVLDPFAGGGAIPLEAMRLGCDVTAADINPVAWFLLKCTLEYPQRLAGQQRPLPDFVRQDEAFLTDFFKAQGFKNKALAAQVARVMMGVAAKTDQLVGMEASITLPETDLAWHVRAWGGWVLRRARADLEHFYPTIDNQSTVAYLWARTVACKNCRATLPLLKTRWLCKKADKRVLLTMAPNAERTGVVFGIQTDVPRQGGNNAQRTTHDKQLGAGTMASNGASCPCCGTLMTMADIRMEGMAGRLGAAMTAVVVDGGKVGKAYRLPSPDEIALAAEAGQHVAEVFAEIPFGVPDEPLPTKEALGFRVPLYGFDQWSKLFTPRQLLALGTFVRHTRAAREALAEAGYPKEWTEAIVAYLACMVDRLSNQCSSISHWNQGGENIEGTFARFVLPMIWDFAEVNPLSNTSGGFPSAYDWITLVTEHFLKFPAMNTNTLVNHFSATRTKQRELVDIVITDPPYYDAIPYSDLMDFFYVWLRRSLHGLSAEIDAAFSALLSPKWDKDRNDGELIDDASRFGDDKAASKKNYEDGMARAFQACHETLTEDGRLVIVFAHKDPNAWETLVSAIIRAGFVVNGSWPIQTERSARTRSIGSAALSSSVWLVCKKRSAAAKPDWDGPVLETMRERIRVKLHAFWDAGIRGPDFIWAATGPALEAYSQHPIVKKADDPGAVFTVREFLAQVRRIVVDFAVGRVLESGGGSEADERGLDGVTAYYLLHRNTFQLGEAPIGASILYATSCGASDSDLSQRHDLLARKERAAAVEIDEDGEEDDEAGESGADEDESDAAAGSKGSTVKLKPWNQRNRKLLRDEIAIDQIHKLLWLWKEGDLDKVNRYLDARSLQRSPSFRHLLQAVIELAQESGEERSLLESLSNHIGYVAEQHGSVQLTITSTLMEE